MKISQPIQPMLVAETKNSETKFRDVIKNHKGKTFSEIKYDGYRVQVHKNSGIWLFTKNLNLLNLELFPELNLNKLPNGIYDGELVGYGNGIQGYNSVKKRVRGELDKKLAEQYPLQIRFFDIMQLGQNELIAKPLSERRRILEQEVENVSELEIVSDPERLRAKFTQVTDEGIEGIVCKNPYSLYIPGSKKNDWVKIKKFSTLDLVVLGVYNGEGKASSLPFAALLLGTINPQGNYETITKVGISNRETIDKIYQKIRPNLTSHAPDNVILSPELKKKTYARKVPSSYVNPSSSCVLELEFLNITRSKNWHSCGLDKGYAYSLRIPTVKRFREDKLVSEINTTEQVGDLYSN